MIKPAYLRHNYIFLAGLFMLAAGLPLSKFLTGFSQIVLAASFFIEGNLAEKLIRLKKNKAAWIISGIWLMHIAGLINTESIPSGLWDIRMKLPVLVLTIVIAGSMQLSFPEVKKVCGAAANRSGYGCNWRFDRKDRTLEEAFYQYRNELFLKSGGALRVLLTVLPFEAGLTAFVAGVLLAVKNLPENTLTGEKGN